MSSPSVDQTIDDRSSGAIPEDTSATLVIAGTCSSGTVNTVYGPYEGSDAIDDLVGDLVGGPAVEAAALMLSQNGSPVYVVPTDQTSATGGSVSTVAHSGTGSMVVAFTGTPTCDRECILKVLDTGEFAACTAKFSDDGGQTWSKVFTLSASITTFVATTGLTITCTAGTGNDCVAGDTYSTTALAKVATDANYAVAIQAAIDEDITFGLLHCVGMPTGADNAAKSASTASRVAQIDLKGAAAATVHKYFHAINDSADVANSTAGDTALTAAFASTESVYTTQGAGFLDTYDPIGLTWRKQPLSWALVNRLRQIPPSESAGFVGRGSLGSAFRIKRNVNGTKTLYNDNRRRRTLDNAKFATATTLTTKRGVYLTRANTLAPTGSDFAQIEARRVINLTAQTAYAVLINFLNAKIKVDKTTGRITEDEASRIESICNTTLRSALGSNAVDVYLVVNRTDNLLTDPTLRVKTFVIPYGYATQITNTIAFLNTAVQLQEAA